MAASGPHRLWHYSGEVPLQKSLIVYTDGTVREGVEFEIDDVYGPNVHTFILGGTDFRAEVGSWIYDTLVAAGYSWSAS